jgi:quinol monooxygenase YgiN
MSIHFLVAIIGTLMGAAGTGMLITRCLRAPNAVLIAWTVAIFGLTVALSAQAVGYDAGFGPIAFRVMEIGAQALAPLALAFGLADLAGKSIVSRFATRLVLTAVAIVALVILTIDPLSASAFTKAWPPATVYYQIVPNKLLEFVLAPITAGVAVVAMVVIASRPGRDPAWKDAFPAAAAAGAAALMLAVPSVIALLGLSLPVASVFTLLCAIAAGATWLGGIRAARLRLELLHQNTGRDEEPESEGEWGLQRSWSHAPDRTGDPVADDDEFGIYRPRNGAARPPDDDLDYHGANGHRQFSDDSGYLDQTGFGDGAGYRDEPAFTDSGYRDQRGYRTDYPGSPRPPGGSPAPSAPLFGQIAIYTLLEDRVEDFDQLTKKVVKLVRAQEPDTLVYIVHAVPSAPMQRILYEVYRDRDAYEAHRRQPYVLAFEADRRPFVLATNIIELGLQQAKVSPLPSVSALLQDTGFDLLNDTGFGQPGFAPRPPAAGPRGGPAGDPLAGTRHSGPHRRPRPGAGPDGDPRAGSGRYGDSVAADRPYGNPLAGDGLYGDPVTGQQAPYADPRADDRPYGDPLADDRPYGDPLADDRPYGDPLAGDGPIGGAGPRRLR